LVQATHKSHGCIDYIGSNSVKPLVMSKEAVNVYRMRRLKD
jgi:hypothetical protein